MQRTLNLKVVGGIVIALVLLGVGAWAVRAWQVQRTAAQLAQESLQAEAEGKLDVAADRAGLYLYYRPRDLEAMRRYGFLLDRLATTPENRLKAWAVLDRVLRREPGRQDLRRHLARMAVEMERYTDGRGYLEVLLRTSPDDVELLAQMARCQEALRDHAQAAESLTRAIKVDPRRIDLSDRLAILLQRQLEQPERAVAVLDATVAANEGSFQAYLARARYRKEFGTAEDWAKDVEKAGELGPDELGVILATAELRQTAGHFDEAREWLERGMKRHPGQASLYRALAALELEAGRPKEAVVVLRRGVQDLPERKDLLEALTEALLETGDEQAAGELLAKLRQTSSPLRVAYLEALVCMHRGQWLPAVRLLEGLRPKLTSPPGLRRVEAALATCYEQLGCPDRQVAVCRAVVVREPSWALGRLNLVSALLAARRLDEAVHECRQVVAFPRPPIGGLQLLARALFLRNLGGPADQQDWREVEQILDRLDRLTPKDVAVPSLRAEMLAAQGQPERARTVLEKARDQQPDKAELWIAVASLAAARNQSDEAVALLAQGQERLGDRIDLRLARARILAGRPAKEVDTQALSGLESGLDPFGPADRARLFSGLGEAWRRIGNLRETERLWEKAAAAQPDDLRPRLDLLDLAIQASDDDALRRRIDDLRRQEKEEGTFWRYGEAIRLLLRAKRGDQEMLTQVRGLVQEIARQRPDWARLVLIEARIEDLTGHGQVALAAYLRAFDLGERQPDAIRRAVQLLYEGRRYAEADELLRKVQPTALVGSRLGRLAAEVSLRAEDPRRALELARKAVPASSTDAGEQLWLGQLLWAAGEKDEAGTALRRAVDLGPRAPEAWVALVQYLARTGQAEKARTAAEEAQGKLPPDVAPLALGLCFEIAGQPDQAEAQYRAALEARPNDAGSLRGAALFYQRAGQPGKAEPLLRKLLDTRTEAPAADAAWARRSLAILLAQRGTHAGFREAFALVEPKRAGTSEPAEDQRARAAVLATRPGRQRQAARLLEAVGQSQPLPPADQFLLVRLHEATGESAKARGGLASLLASDANNPDYLAHYVRFLLRQGEAESASRWLDRLEKQPGQALRSLELRARLLKAEGKGNEAAVLLGNAVKARQAPLLVAAPLLEELGEATAAEPLYREYASTPGKPGNALVLIAFLGRQGRLAEALDLLDRSWDECPPADAALTGVALLRHAKATPGDGERVERLLQRAIEKQSERTILLIHLATLQDRQGRHADAQAAYRQVLDRESTNVVALNNLAWLLAHEQGQGPAALELIERAIRVAGPLPELLDTRAAVQVNLGNSAAAVKDLEEVVGDVPTPGRWFHLARARLLARNRDAAREALQQGLAVGLKPELLHPLERPGYQPLVADLDQS